MPPRINSRYMFSEQYTDPVTGRLVLTRPIPFAFQNFDDNDRYVVQAGDTLWNIAAKRFKGFPRPAGLWWVIAQFNGIYDPTLALQANTILILPSVRTLHDAVFSETRRSANY